MPLLRSWVAYAAMPLAGIVTAPILAHALGPEGRGQLAGLLQPLTLAGAIASIGVPSAVTYFIAQKACNQRILIIASKLATISTLMVAICLILYSYQVSSQLSLRQTSVLLIWSAFIPSAYISIRRSQIQGHRLYSILDAERFLAAFLRVGIIFILWLLGVTSVILFAAAYMFAGLLASSSLFYSKNPISENGIINGYPSRKTFVSYSLLASLGTIAAAANARLDQAIMPAVIPPVEIGYYSVAVAIADISSILTSVAVRNVLSEASSSVGLMSILKTSIVGAVAQILLIALMIFCLPILLPLVFGDDFRPAVGIVNILLFGSFASYWASVGTSFLTGSGKPGLGSIVQGTAGLTTGGLFWFWWEGITAETAAWISVYSQLAAFTLALCLVVRILVAQKHAKPTI